VLIGNRIMRRMIFSADFFFYHLISDTGLMQNHLQGFFVENFFLYNFVGNTILATGFAVD
jgi:hypothetical protein